MTTEVSFAISASSSGLTASRGRFTDTPDCSKGVTIIKMIRSTSMTSTIGVTLISEFSSAVPPTCIAIAVDLLDGQANRAYPTSPGQLASERLATLLDEVVDELRSRVL